MVGRSLFIFEHRTSNHASAMGDAGGSRAVDRDHTVQVTDSSNPAEVATASLSLTVGP